MDHQPSVGRPPDVEFHPVGPQFQGAGKSLQGVLPPVSASAPVGQDDHGITLPTSGPAHYLVNHVAPFSCDFAHFHRF
jgi:hypothetical protein